MGGNLILGGCRFIDPDSGLVSAIREEDMLQEGKHPGKTNLTDLDNGLNIMKYLMGKPAAAILKHNNPCGVAYGATLAEAYRRANRADRIAAFGGCLVLNRPVDKETAALIAENYLEVVGAPDYEEGTLEILKGRASLRIIQLAKIDRLTDYLSRRFVDIKSLIDGGIIVQQSPLNRVKGAGDLMLAETTYKDKTYRIERPPTAREMEDLLFGWFVEQGVTSNSVLYVKDGCTVGIGTGEQDRVGVAEIAVYKAYQKYADALCFDRYGIPYKDLELAIEKGTRPKEEKERIDAETKAAKGGLDRRGDGFGCLLSLPGRRGCGDPAGGDRRGPARRFHAGLGSDRGLQRGGGDDGPDGPEGLQTLTGSTTRKPRLGLPEGIIKIPSGQVCGSQSVRDIHLHAVELRPGRTVRPFFWRTSIALSGASNRKMITAFSPLLSTKAYRYSTLIPFLDRTSRMLVEPARTVRDLDGHDGGPAETEAVFLQDAARLLHVVDDQAEDAEIGGVRQRQGSDVDRASFRMRVTSSRPPGLFSRNMEICSTFIDEPPFMTCSPVIPLARAFAKKHQIWRLSCTRLALPSNRWRDLGSTSFTLAETPR